MALDQSALMELLDALKAADGGDVVRSAVQAGVPGADRGGGDRRDRGGPHERSPERVTRRNGYRDRPLTTAAGNVELRIPKLRSGSFFPSLLERRRRIDQAAPRVLADHPPHSR